MADLNLVSTATGLPNANALDQDYLREMADMGNERLHDYSLAENYYVGKQNTLLTDRSKSYLERSGLEYNENYCSTIVNALADRLRVIGVSTPEFPDLGDYLWTEIWDRNRLDAEQHRFHTTLLEYGDVYLATEFDQKKGHAVITLNYPDMIRADYSDGEMIRAVKVWTTDAPSPVNPPQGGSRRGRAVKRMNIYYADRIEKYYRLGKESSALWAPWIEEGDTVYPIPNYINDDPSMPRGIPLVHFANMRQRNGYGVAEHRSTIPQQDRLNKELADLALVLDTLGFPQRYAVGVTGATTLRSVPGEVWSSEDPNTAFGQFPAADPSGILKAIESTMGRIASQSRTPAHMILVSGGAPSGESLKTAEAGIVAKAKSRQYEWGESWVNALRLAAVLNNEMAEPAKRYPITMEDLLLTPINLQWADPVSRNEKEHLESLTIMSGLGVSQHTILSKLEGIDPMTEIHNQTQELGTSQNAIADAVNRGTPSIGG